MMCNGLSKGALILAVSVLNCSVASASMVTIGGQSNIFGAGHAAPPMGVLGSGLLPPVFSFSAGAGQVLTFSSVSGSVRIDNDNNPGYSNGPDGGTLYTSTNVSSVGGISGVVHDAKTMFLVGVFLDGSEPVDPPPSTLNFSASALGENFATLAPSLRQVFFIGDGLTGTGSGSVQQFYVPTNATRLYMGFADAYDGTIGGAPGYYIDNDGELIATFEISSVAAVPEPTSLALTCLGSGVLGICIRRSRRRQDCSKEDSLCL